MTAPGVFVVVLSVVALLYVPAALFRDREFSPLLIGSGSLLLTLLGLFVLGSAIEFVSGSTSVTVAGTETVTNDYAAIPGVLNTAIGTILAMAGLGGIYAAFSHMRSLKEAMRRESDDDGIEPLPK